MALTPAEKQREYRKRLAKVVAQGRAVQAGEALPPIPLLPASQHTAVARAIALEITKARGRIASLQRKRGEAAAQERRDLERTIDFWRAVLAGQGIAAAD